MYPRVIALDTELTGLDLENGDRIIQLGLVEIINEKTLGKERKWTFNPEGRKSHPNALKIHKLSDQFLSRFKSFSNHIMEIQDFIGDSPITHHCWIHEKQAPISPDEYALRLEFERVGAEPINHHQWINTKIWAHQILNGNKPYTNHGSSLIAISEHLGIDTTPLKGAHDALSDAKIHAQNFITMRPKFPYD